MYAAVEGGVSDGWVLVEMLVKNNSVEISVRGSE